MWYLQHARVLVLLASLGGLFPLAATSSPVPAWIKGLYDGGDYHDVFGLVPSADTERSEKATRLGKQSFRNGLLVASACDSLQPLTLLLNLRLRSPPKS